MEFTIHPELPASDIQRARAWYKEKLGLDPVTVGGEPFDPDAEPSDHELLYDTGTATFGIYETPHAGTNFATAARLVTNGFDAAHAELLANGVVFEEYTIEDGFSEENGTPYFLDGVLISPDGEKTAWFKDSEGNILALSSI
jgi:catechol 2,3-dioxygenase-like lactoylglutathione lyase family enzyme